MKVSVKICSGTACYIVGGAKLLAIDEYLSKKELEKVVIEGSSCMGFCTEYDSKIPYAMVNGEVIPKANVKLLVQKIKAAIDSSGI